MNKTLHLIFMFKQILSKLLLFFAAGIFILLEKDLISFSYEISI